MEHPHSGLEGRGRAGGFGDQLALDLARAARAPAARRGAEAAARGVRGAFAEIPLSRIRLRPLPARRAVAGAEGLGIAVEAGGAGGEVGRRLDDVDRGLRQFVDEARGDGRGPQAVDAAVDGEGQLGALARARQPDMGEPPLLLEAGPAALVQRPLVREQAVLPAGQEHRVEFQALGRVQRHQRDALGPLGFRGLHHQRDVLQEGGHVRKLLHGAHELLEVLQPPGGVGRLLLLPHLGVAGFLEDGLCHLGMRVVLHQPRPARKALGERAKRRADPGLELVGLAQLSRGVEKRDLLGAGVEVELLQRRVAQAALRGVDDPLEGEVVGGVAGDAQVGQRVADLGALVEARAADHPVGQAELDEAVLDLAHLGRDPHQHRDLGERMLLGLERLDRFREEPRFLLRVPSAGDGDRLAVDVLGPQRLAQPTLVLGDQARGGGQDVAGGAVVALQPHHHGARKIVLEAQDVVDLGAAPAVDRLVVVADAGDVLAHLAEQPEPEVLGDVGVLVLVDEYVAELVLVGGQHVRVVAPQLEAQQQQVAEVDRVQGGEPGLVGGVEVAALAEGEGLRFACRHLLRPEPAVLPAVDRVAERARRPALLVDVLVFQHLLHQAELVVGAEDREVGFQPDQLGVAAQDLGADGVEGAEPGHALAGRPDQRADPVLHLPRGLVGEGHRQDVEGPRPARGDQVRDARGEHPRLAGAGAGQHQDRAFRRLDGAALLVVQAVEIGGCARAEAAHRACGDGGGATPRVGRRRRMRRVRHRQSLDQNANGVEARTRCRPPGDGSGGNLKRAGRLLTSSTETATRKDRCASCRSPSSPSSPPPPPSRRSGRATPTPPTSPSPARASRGRFSRTSPRRTTPRAWTSSAASRCSRRRPVRA